MPVVCMAEFETNAILTLGDTHWSQSSATEDIGFHENKVYICYGEACAKMPGAVYFDFIFYSLFVVDTGGFRIDGLLFPLVGYGVAINSSTNVPYIMSKTSDSWIPPQF